MAFSYNPALIIDKDQIRFLVQDTNPQNFFFDDSEIVWAISTEANIYMAGALLCDILVQRAGGVTSKRIGDLAVTYDVSFYRILAGQLRARGSGHQLPYAGGISQPDKEILQNDATATKPAIMRRLDDNPAAPSPVIPSANPLTSI